eukprot:326195-Rhodomonas_salina.1
MGGGVVRQGGAAEVADGGQRWEGLGAALVSPPPRRGLYQPCTRHRPHSTHARRSRTVGNKEAHATDAGVASVGSKAGNRGRELGGCDRCAAASASPLTPARPRL